MNTQGEVVSQDAVQRAGAIRAEEQQLYLASQWQLMWWRFRKNKLAIVSAVVIFFLYAIGAFCEFIAPYDPRNYDEMLSYSPPRRVHFVDQDGFHLRPFVYGQIRQRNPESFQLEYTVDPSQRYPLYAFVHGDPYEFWGIWRTDVHLFGTRDPEGRAFLLGADRLGRDMLSRIVYGSRISLSIGLIGVAVSFVLGILLGGISGYYGGVVDVIVQRVIEFLRSIPSIPLWMALSASLPREWSTTQTYFAITVLLSLIGWTGLARVTRGRFLALREEEFVIAARLAGSSELRVIVRHLVPSFLSYIIASLTLSIPSMILSETSLSFLNLGLRAPAISWGVLLQEAQTLMTVALAPWLLLPGFFVVVAVLAFNFVGDGLRDAADPYAR